MSLLCFLAAGLIPALSASVALIAAGATLAAIVVVLAVMGGSRSMWRRRSRDLLQDLHRDDRAAVFLSGTDGDIVWSNPSAIRRVGGDSTTSLLSYLEGGLADPGQLYDELFARALDEGSAEDRIDMPSGVLSLSATRSGEDYVVWRLDKLPSQDVPAGVMRLRDDGHGRITACSDILASKLVDPCDTLDDVLLGPVSPGAAATLRTIEGEQTVAMDVHEVRGGRHLTLVPLRQRVEAPKLDSLPVPLLELLPSGEICASNRLSRQLLRIEEEEVVQLSDLVEGLGRPVGDWITGAFEGRSLHRPEVGRTTRSAGDTFVQITLDKIEDDDEKIVALLHDATELKTLEAQFVQSQKMQAIGQLAGGVAHDFNNLLTAISGHCDLLLLRHDPGDQDFADLEQINQNANRAASLVGQLLAFSRKQNLSPEPLDLRDILADLTHLLNRLVGERVSLSFRHDPALGMVTADRRQLEQVIMNLVVNARDAMADGGAIVVETQQVRLPRALQRDRAEVPAGDYVVVKVSDEGIGIDPEKLTKIFEPFYTTKRPGEGTGLGLSTAYGIVKQTGGYIFADSVPSKGTTFSLYFPAFFQNRTSSPAAPKPEPSYSGDRGNGVLLLVEDEAPVRAFAARALTMRGYTVIEAGDAEEALDLLDDADLQVDLFLSDVIMPGLDGPGWVQKARADRPDVPVIFMSGYAEESFAGNQARIPNSAFLPKPFSLADLVEMVRGSVAESRR